MRAAKIAGLIAVLAIVGFLTFHFMTGQKPDQSVPESGFDDVAYFGALRDENFVLPGQPQLDIDDLLSSIPGIVQITHSKIEFDQASGATVLSDVKVSIKDYPGSGVAIDQLSLWGVDGTAFKERLSGERLGETVLIAKRVEADNVSMFGLEKLFDQFLQATTELSTDWVESIASGDGVAIRESIPDQSLEKYDFYISRIVMTDLVFHPFVLDLQPLPDKIKDHENSEDDIALEAAWHWVQKFAAWNYAYGLKDFAAYDSRFELVMKQDDMVMGMSSKTGLVAYRKIHKGDWEFGVVRNSIGVMDMSMPPIGNPDDKTNIIEMRTDTQTEFYSFEKVKFSKLWEHLARGVMPDRTVTDIMSLGVWNGGKHTSKFNDVDLYSVDSFYLDMSEFHWLIPEVVDVRVENMTFNVKGLIDYVRKNMESAGTDLDVDMSMSDDQIKTMNEVVKILEKYGLDAPSMDLNFATHWDADTGLSDVGYNYNIDDFIRYQVRVDAKLPSYDAAMSAVPENLEEFDEDQFAQVFLDALQFINYEVHIEDKGALDKGFAMAVDFAQLAPEGEASMEMFRNTTPEILRNMVSNGILVALVEIDKTFPPGVDYLQSVSKFIGEGGSLTLAIKPRPPLGVADFEDIESWAKEDPDAIVKKLGISVVHQPAQ